MSFPSKGQMGGLAATRRSARLRAAEVSGTEVLDPAPASLLGATFERSTSNRITSATSEQKLFEPSQLPSSDPPDVIDETVEPRRSGRNESSKKRKRPAGSEVNLHAEAMECIMTPVTAEDREKWKGWCEVESEPVSFLLRSIHCHLTSGPYGYDHS